MASHYFDNYTFGRNGSGGLWPSVTSEYVNAFDFEIYNIARTRNFMSSLSPFTALVCLLYVTSIFGGQHWMRNRKPYYFQRSLFLWNAMLALFSIVGFVRVFPEAYHLFRGPNGLYKSCCKLDVHNYATSFWALLFVLSKLVELGDTAFVVLRKRKLIFLHWFHHCTVFFFAWTFYDTYDPLFRVGGTFNYFVHSIMYTYYALMTLKVQIPKAFSKCLTALQILQMITVLLSNLYTLYVMRKGIPCERPMSNIVITFTVGGMYLILFINFFIRTYILTPRGKKIQ